MIELTDLTFSYDEAARPALSDIALTISKGEWVTLMGANGSGKSTLVMLILGLLNGAKGSITVDGLNPFDPNEVWEVRRKIGMVFQNPDTQMVSSSVEREIAFAPENYGMIRELMLQAVDRGTERFHLLAYRQRSPHELSGGERQRVALASGAVMDGDYLLLDEPTALLDPAGRKEFLDFLEQLRPAKGILYVTADASEALRADRLVILHDGEVAADGRPMEVLTSDAPLWDWGVEIPLEAELQRLEQSRGAN